MLIDRYKVDIKETADPSVEIDFASLSVGSKHGAGLDFQNGSSVAQAIRPYHSSNSNSIPWLQFHVDLQHFCSD
jgi:hypothetical protein